MLSEISVSDSDVVKVKQLFEGVSAELNKVIVGQQPMVEALLIAILAGGHVLLEGVPGLAKTTAIKALAKTLDLHFNRIQFTPDLLPSDLLGTEVFNPKESNFYIRKGPLFAQLILADEINRAPAKVQSALLEVMEEHQISLAGQTFKLTEPFFVLATQNPIEQEGTYRLPEAQVDRFLLKTVLTHPSREEELEILRRMQHGMPTTQVVASAQDLLAAKAVVKNLYLDEKVEMYIVQLVDATRHPNQYGLSSIAKYIEVGASPRATLGLSIAARSKAVLAGRTFVTPQDVKDVAYAVLRHRLILTYEAQADQVRSEDMIDHILRTVVVP